MRERVIDLTSVPDADALEKGIAGGKLEVVEHGSAKRIPAAARQEAPEDPDSRYAHVEGGRIPPLNLPRGKAGASQGVNGFVIAVRETNGEG